MPQACLRSCLLALGRVLGIEPLPCMLVEQNCVFCCVTCSFRAYVDCSNGAGSLPGTWGQQGAFPQLTLLTAEGNGLSGDSSCKQYISACCLCNLALLPMPGLAAQAVSVYQLQSAGAEALLH